MPAGYGIAGHFGCARETTWGTAVTADTYAPLMSENMAFQVDRFPLKNVHAAFYEPDDMTGLVRAQGQLVLPFYPDIAGRLLRCAMGVHSLTVVASPFNRHTFTIASSDSATTNPFPAMTVEIFRDVTSSQQYDGGQINQLTLRTAPNEPWMATVDMIFRAARNIAKTTATFVTSPTQPFAFDTTSIGLAGAASAVFEDFTVTINNNLESVGTLNASTNIGKIRRTDAQTVRVAGTIGFEDITEFNNFLNQTEQAININATRANSFSLLVELPRVVWTAVPLGMSGRGRQLVAVEGMARYHTGSGAALKFTLTNVTSNH